MDYKTYFKCIDDICNKTNYSYHSAVDRLYKLNKRQTTLYGIKPIYIKEIDKYYIPNNTLLDDVIGINK